MKIKAIGIDLAFANMGFARTEIDLSLQGLRAITCNELILAQSAKTSGKNVRVSSDRLARAIEQHDALVKACQGMQVAFVEVPSGAQSAGAATALGIAIGVMSACPIPIVEVSPMEVKAAVAGRKVAKGASKAEVIEWAVQQWPDAPWMRATKAASSRKKGQQAVRLEAGRLLNENEHLADAMASVAAGISTPAFKQLLSILQHAIPSTPDQRPTPRRERLRLL